MPPNQRPQRVYRFDNEWNEPLAFSQAVRAGNQLWIAGQVAVDDEGTPVGVDDAAAQAERVWHNLERVLAAAGGRLDDLVATTTYLVVRADRELAAAARERWLAGPDWPTNTLLIVDGLGRPEWRIEISAVAVLPG